MKSYALDGRWKDSERDDGPTMAGFCKNELCSRVFRCVQFTASVDNVDMPHNSQDLKKSRGRVRHMHWSIGYNPGQGGIARVLLERTLCRV